MYAAAPRASAPLAVLTVNSRASAWLPLDAAVSATPTPSVVGTTQNKAKPVANSRGCRGISIMRKAKQGVNSKMAARPYRTPTQCFSKALQQTAQAGGGRVGRLTQTQA